MRDYFWNKFTGKLALICLMGTVFVSIYSCSTPNITETNSSDLGKKQVGKEAMVSSAHPLASEAGLEMLRNGGNAVDAAVATAFALNVVEPNMSGIGGGGSMLIWNQDEMSADYVDFYSAKSADTYLGMAETQGDEIDDEFDLLSTGVPGTVAGLLGALEKHGTLSRQEVMAPAIRYAREGFPVYPTLGQFIIDNEEKLARFEGAEKTFWPGGEPLSVGEILIQPELATTLQSIADEGRNAFYNSTITDNVVDLLNDYGNPVTVQDFRNYEPQWQKEPLCGTYKNYVVLSAPMPQTGVFIIQALNILENYDLRSIGAPTESAEAFDILTSTLRLSIADRIEYVTDPNWETIPVDGLISKEYASSRSTVVGIGEAKGEIQAGDPRKFTESDMPAECQQFIAFAKPSESIIQDDGYFVSTLSSGFGSAQYSAVDEAAGTGETTHISIIDGEGNAVSLSTTLSPVFGSGAWVNGFILNSSGYNFSNMEETDQNGNHPYRVRASTISPTIILKDGEPELVIGAPGGGRIPTAILQNIIYILDYGMDPLDAVRMPRIFPSRDNSEVQIEVGFNHDVLSEVRDMGYDIQSLSRGYARLYLVYKKENGLIGVSDPRHDGEPRGY